jgi:UDP-N-acetylmuramate dehydrogenase
MPEVDPVPLARLTTLQVGGTPDRMVEARTDAELVEVLTELWTNGESWLVVGGGSNLFPGDGPVQGTVVRILTTGIERLPSPRAGFARLKVAAGHSWDDLVATAVAEGLGGIEAMSGIPGTVGAAPIQNIGAYGQDISQTLVEVELLDEGADAPVTVPAADLRLGFRTSALKHHYGSEAHRPAVILSATFELEEGGHHERPVHSSQLRTAVGAGEVGATLRSIRERVLELRRSKGMVLDPADSDTNSVGSFFQNAIVSESFARTLPPECPRWSIGADHDVATVIPLDEYQGIVPVQGGDTPDFKVSAGWLIEHAGIRKGFRLPRSRAAVSGKHALALVNRGGATAEEVAELARYVRARVASEFGLWLHPEPMLVGVEI